MGREMRQRKRVAQNRSAPGKPGAAVAGDPTAAAAARSGLYPKGLTSLTKFSMSTIVNWPGSAEGSSGFQF